jgi:hypothetical protein
VIGDRDHSQTGGDRFFGHTPAVVLPVGVRRV